MGKTRNSTDFINHLKNIKRYVLKRNIKRLFLYWTTHVSCRKRQAVCGKTIGWLTVVYPSSRKCLPNNRISKSFSILTIRIIKLVHLENHTIEYFLDYYGSLYCYYCRNSPSELFKDL